METETMDIDVVRAEKEEAMRRYNRQRKLKTCVRIASLFCFLVLFFSWSSPQIPAAMETVGEFSRSLKSVLYQRQYVFLLTNALVLAIYFSNQENADVAKPDLYDEYLSKSKSASASASAAADLHFPSSKIANRNPRSPVKKTGKTKSALVVFTECSAPETKSGVKVAETGRRYRRSQSENLERPKVAKVRREMRRTETVAGRQSMEEMSSEEFRITVESFIAKKKRDLREQDINMLHSPSGGAEP